MKWNSILFFLLAVYSVNAQEREWYKEVDTVRLYLVKYFPENMDKDKPIPAIVFFYGGGWSSGNIDQFKPHAQYFSKRGLACFTVDYRVRKRQQTSPDAALRDAKSAIRHVRKNATRYGIDPTKIIAAGGSAGGHLAAATALIGGYNEPTDDVSISCIPNALVLFNPVIDNGPGGYGYDRIGEEYIRFSPLHNIHAGAPPTIFFLGTNDRLIPVETAKYYQLIMEKVGSRCDLHLFQDKGHGFFNHKHFDMYQATVEKADSFLQSLGYLNEKPLVKIEE